MLVEKRKKHGVMASGKLYEAGSVDKLYGKVQMIQCHHEVLVQLHLCYQSNLKTQSELHGSGKTQLNWKNILGGCSKCGINFQVFGV